MPQSPLLSSLERKSGLIAYIGLDGNIYTIDFSFPAAEDREQKFKWSLLNLDGILEIKID